MTAGEHSGRVYVGDELTDGKWLDKIAEIISAESAPKMTKIVMAGDKGYSRQVADADIFNNMGYKDAFTFSDDEQYMTMDLRELLGIEDEFEFAEDSCTLTIDYTYSDGYKQKGSKNYKFDLSPNSFSPGELTHIAIVKAERYDAPWRAERPDVKNKRLGCRVGGKLR